MPGKEELGGAADGETSFFVSKAVALIACQKIDRFNIALPKRRDDAVGLRLGDTRVVGALEDENRRRQTVDRVNGGARRHSGALLRVGWIADKSVPRARQEWMP